MQPPSKFQQLCHFQSALLRGAKLQIHLPPRSAKNFGLFRPFPGAPHRSPVPHAEHPPASMRRGRPEAFASVSKASSPTILGTKVITICRSSPGLAEGGALRDKGAEKLEAFDCGGGGGVSGTHSAARGTRNGTLAVAEPPGSGRHRAKFDLSLSLSRHSKRPEGRHEPPKAYPSESMRATMSMRNSSSAMRPFDTLKRRALKCRALWR